MQTKPISNKFMKLHWLLIFFVVGLLAYSWGEQVSYTAIQIIAQDLIFPAAGFFFAIYFSLRIVDHSSVGSKIPRENTSLIAIVIMLVLFFIYLTIPYLFLNQIPKT
jgi:hypothetical protein